MQDPDSPGAGSRRPSRPVEAHSLYVITLVSSPAPARLEAPAAPEFAGLAVFRSRLVEDGRERFRVHVGYFPSAAAAERLLPAARRTHPAAFVALAPYADMGSLDDTAMARFSILQAPDADALAPRPPLTPQRPAAPAVAIRRGEAGTPAATAATAPVAPKRVEAAGAVTQPRHETPTARARTPQPPKIEPAVETAPNAPPRLEPAAPAEALQKFAVQLIWTRDPIDVAKIARLKIFNGYLLYAVETEPGGRREYGVRLGFYSDALSAGLVAQYVRPAFKDAAVVPVSAREFARAAAAVIRVRPAHAPGGRARWPAAAVPLATVRAAR